MTATGIEHRLGGFRLLGADAPVGEGGQGAVCRAVCERADFPGLSVGETVALKVIPASDSDETRWQRLESMVSTLAALDSPNLVRYYGCFRERSGVVRVLVGVMELLEGETLRARLSRNPGGLDADVALDVAKAAATGLAAAAAAGFVHRDVKPDNIFLCSDGRVKIIDFGIARREDSTATTNLLLVGSFDYMAPERTDQEFRGDERADVFSLGVVLHEALFGHLPYAARTTRPEFAFFDRWSKRSRATALTPDGRAGRIVPGLDEVLRRALAVEREERFADFATFAAALDGLKPHEIRSEHEVYRVAALLGEGGFGEVFRARRLRDGATVALKHLKRMDGDAARRFQVEARTMAAIDDPAFVRFYEYFESGHVAAPQVYLAMAYLEGMPGRSLRDALAAAGGRGLPPGDVLGAFARYARGLAVLHAHEIVHRDIKPSNLYFAAGDIGKSVIMDLGVALDWNATQATGSVPGTPDYMPPEVITGSSRGSPASDIYALGACLYEALTGRSLFPRFKTGTADAFEAFLVRARQMRAPRLDAPLVAANPDLERLIRHMTEPDAGRRMASAAEAEMEIYDLLDAFERGDWTLPPASEDPATDAAGVGDTRDAQTVGEGTLTAEGPTELTLAERSTVDAVPPTVRSKAPIPVYRRIIRNRRELFLVLALVIELASNAVIVWQRPRREAPADAAVVSEAEHRRLTERFREAEEARVRAEREATAAGRREVPVQNILKREGGL